MGPAAPRHDCAGRDPSAWSTRHDATGRRPGAQTLYYTLPIGDGGFLTGTVRMQDDKVQDVEKPVLKPVAKPAPER